MVRKSKNKLSNGVYPEVKVKDVMATFYDDAGIWFSLKEINVNKGGYCSNQSNEY